MSDSIACLHKRIPASSRAAQKQADFDLPKGRNSLLFGVGIRAALARIGCFEWEMMKAVNDHGENNTA